MGSQDWEGKDEVRQFKRLHVPIHIRYVHHPRQRGDPRSGLTAARNISGAGVCLEAEDSYEESEILELAIELEKDRHPVEALARVIWAEKTDRKERPFDLGVEFIGIEDEDRELIDSKAVEQKK